jgi:hypothetical protein
MHIYRAPLAGLQERLQNRLLLEPSQTGCMHSAPAVEPRNFYSLERFGGIASL